jgi:hypothetical protein
LRQPADDDQASAGGGMDSKTGDGTKRPPLRSSIACLRCRKSKIKCDNQGAAGPCDTCIKTGKDCRYPDHPPLPTKRIDPPAAAKVDAPSAPEKKRLKKNDDARGDPGLPAAVAEEVLSVHYLTPALWKKLFTIYQQHFLTELPFLHVPTLKEKTAFRFGGRGASENPHETNLVLLGILALTARFEPDLVKYVANTRSPLPGSAKNRPLHSTPDSAAASEYFAETLITALGPLSSCATIATIERVQAFLMLGLFEWSQAKPKTGGLGAWMYVGLAIRMAQAMRLGFGDRYEPTWGPRGRAVSMSSKTSVSNPLSIANKEIRRRTMFSCLILDRMLACGQDRVSTIRSEDLQIRLPCSEHEFDFSTDVTMRFLNHSEEEGVRSPLGHQAARDDSVLGSFIRLVDIWGEISKYSFAGGRHSEKAGRGPWDQDSKFFQLRQKLERFHADLPESFQWSWTNYHRHEDNSGSIFVSLHMLSSVCQIMLHREYIPFIPIRCKKPVGPLDAPTFPESEYSVPHGFWEESAEQVFVAAKHISEIIECCGGGAPMSCLTLFAIWTAAFVGIYAFHFPHMDRGGHMVGDEEKGASQIELDPEKSTPISLTYQTLMRMSSKLKLALTYVRHFRDMDRYYHKVKGEFAKYKGQYRKHSGEGGRLGIAQGGEGGGLEEWRVQGSKVINNGAILEADDRHDGSDNHSRASTADRASSYDAEANHHSIASAAFTAINSSPATGLVAAQAALEPRMNGVVGNHNFPMPSPLQGWYSPNAVITFRMIGNQALVPSYVEEDHHFMDYLSTCENFPWNGVPGGPGTLAHGSDSPEIYPDTGGGWNHGDLSYMPLATSYTEAPSYT